MESMGKKSFAQRVWLGLRLLWSVLRASPLYIVVLLAPLLGLPLKAELNQWLAGSGFYVEKKFHLLLLGLSVPHCLLVLAVLVGCLFAAVGYDICIRKLKLQGPALGVFPVLTMLSAISMLATGDLVSPHLLSVFLYYLVFLQFNKRVLASDSTDKALLARVNEWKSANENRCRAYFAFTLVCLLVDGLSVNSASMTRLDELNHDLFNFVSGLVSFEIILGSLVYFSGGMDWFREEWKQLASAGRAPQDMDSLRTESGVSASFLAAVIPVAIAVNLAIGLLVHALKLPLYVDSIGTVFIGFTLGPRWAALVGGLSMVLGGLLLNPWMPYYAGTAVVIGLLSGFFGIRHWQYSIKKTVVLGIIVAVSAAVVSAPVTVLVFGGVTGSGTTVIVALLRASGRKLVESVLITGFAVELVDKVITCLMPVFVIRALPRSLAVRFPLLCR